MLVLLSAPKYKWTTLAQICAKAEKVKSIMLKLIFAFSLQVTLGAQPTKPHEWEIVVLSLN